jgi:hypothetical protein
MVEGSGTDCILKAGYKEGDPWTHTEEELKTSPIHSEWEDGY